jgi:predicted amidohydrolase
MGATWRIAGVQLDCRLGEPRANREAMDARLREAVARGARLVIFPECVVTGYCFASLAEALPFAEPLPGPSSDHFAVLCRELGVFAVYGFLERDGDRLFNSCALVGPGGLVAGYRKTHLPFLGVDRFTTPGDRPLAVHDLGGLRVGLNICFDGSFPEVGRVLALLGADLIVLPTNWPTASLCNARHTSVVRALENHVYYAAVNRVGQERGFSFVGLSRIVGFGGETLAVAEGTEEAIITADIDPLAARDKQVVISPGEYEVNRFSRRRPELYGPLVERGAGG